MEKKDNKIHSITWGFLKYIILKYYILKFVSLEKGMGVETSGKKVLFLEEYWWPSYHAVPKEL